MKIKLKQRICIKWSLNLFLCIIIISLWNMVLEFYIKKNDKYSIQISSNNPIESFEKYIPECPKSIENPIGRRNITIEVPTWSHLLQLYTFTTNITKSSQDKIESTMSVRKTFFKLIKSNHMSKSDVGLWCPTNCKPGEKLAIIVPYRNRDVHLRLFVKHMHEFLRRQQLMYTIFVINQEGTTTFNRALLLNAGFIESYRVADFDCFIFHDVDLLPEDDRNIYRCSEQPRHLSVSIDQYNYKLIYEENFGGVIAVNRQQFEKVGGFSNSYYGWGGEDDDFYKRIIYYNYSIVRYPEEIARYIMLRHERDERNEPNQMRFELLESAESRFNTDGYWTSNYTVIKADSLYNGLIYWISVTI
ncbi:unnamed protein product [Schistosoma rodhaini]|nr:unnamed protein product [Schistosoma rodhaini]